MFCHEVPYFWAMKILHEHEEDWKRKYWPPPKDEVTSEGYMFYHTAYKMESSQKSPQSEFVSWVQRRNSFLDSYYHGCLVPAAERIVHRIDVSIGRLNLDFNPAGKSGFYLTQDVTQATEWALAYAHYKHDAAVIIYKLDPNLLNGFKIKRFGVDDYKEWADYVLQGRAGTLRHNYDAVDGPVYKNPHATDELPRGRGHQFAIYSQGLADVFSSNVVRVLPGVQF